MIKRTKAVIFGGPWYIKLFSVFIGTANVITMMCWLVILVLEGHDVKCLKEDTLAHKSSTRCFVHSTQVLKLNPITSSIT